MNEGDALEPIHPGEILRDEFLTPLGLSPYALAKAMRVPRTRVERIVRGETSITADTALRLNRALGGSPRFWLNLQGRYDLETARDRADAADLEAVENVNPDGRRHAA